MGKSKFIILFLLLCVVPFNLGCSLKEKGSKGSDSLIQSESLSSITGTILHGMGSVSDSIRGSSSNDSNKPVKGAKVLLEEMPELYALTDDEGRYLIDNIPPGTFAIIARYVEAGTEYKMRSEPISIIPGELPEPTDLVVHEAKSFVKGVIRDEKGYFLPLGTELMLWGETFFVQENGKFETPLLPVLEFEKVVSEIIINFKMPNEYRFPAAFVSDDEPPEVEFVVPNDAYSKKALPVVTLVAYIGTEGDKETVTSVKGEEEVTFRAIISPQELANDEFLQWYFPDDSTIIARSILNEKMREVVWLAPKYSQVATISVALYNYAGQIAKANLKIKVEGLQLFKVNYHAGSDSVGEPPTDNKSYKSGEEFIIRSPDSLFKEEHVFIGWSAQRDGFDVEYLPGEESLIGDADVNLYPIWQKDEKTTDEKAIDEKGFEVVYHTNNLTSGTLPKDTNIYQIGDKVVIRGNTGNMFFASHYFVGWNTQSDGKGDLYSPGSELIIADTDINLYAQWNKNPAFRVLYDGNGHESGEAPEDIKVYETGLEAPILGPLTLRKSGYKFMGWKTTKDIDEAQYAEGDRLKITESNVQLYAHWKLLSAVKVYLDQQLPNDNIVQEIEVFYELPYGSLPVCTRDGFVFIGWFSSSSEAGEQIYEDSLVSNPNKHTLFAQWIPATNQVIFNPCQGLTPEPIYKTVVFGEEYGELPITTRYGYRFAGWLSQTGSIVTSDALVATTTTHELFARWFPQQYLVFFDAQNSTAEYPQEISVTFDEEYGELPLVSKTGYIFKGWYTKREDGEIVNETSIVSIANDHTLFARWEPAFVSVNLQYQQKADYSIKNIELRYGERYGSLPVPLADGYVFLGWFLGEKEGSLQITSETLVLQNQPHVIFAHWLVEQNHVIFNPNGGSTPTPTYKKLTPGDFYGSLPQTSREGYNFVGWSADKDSDKIITPDTLVIAASTHELYAIWKPKNYIIYFDLLYDGAKKISSQLCAFGSEYKNLVKPLRSGYTFEGWFTQAVDGTMINEQDTILIPNNHTLYARWVPISILVSFNEQGGSQPEPLEKEVLFGEPYGALPLITKKGFVFAGWKRNDGKIVDSNSRVDISKPHELEAQWLPQSNLVFFNSSGGSNTNPTYLLVDYDKQYGDLPLSEKAGYSFVGWFTEITDGEQIVAESLVATSSTHELFAHWEPIEYEVCFDDLNGGEYEPKRVLFGNELGELPSSERIGYSLKGWYSDVEYGYKVDADTRLNDVGDRILYAHWEPNIYKVSYDSLGAEEDFTSFVVYDGFYGEQPSPYMAGFYLNGWFTEENGAGEKITSNTKVSFAGDHYLYAHWLSLTNNVIFNSNEGIGVNPPYKSVVLYRPYGELPSPTRAGYDFIGWYSDLSYQTLITESTLVATSTTHELFAAWEPIYFYVTFDASGGDLSGPSFAIIAFEEPYGELPEVEKIGYSFEGWFSTQNNRERIEPHTIISIPADHTLYAHWEPKTSLAMFDPAGGELEDVTQKSLIYGKPYGELPIPFWAGYSFVGWCAEDEGEYITPYTIVNSLEPHQLHAVWAKERVLVTFDSDGGSSPKPTFITLDYLEPYGELPTPSKEGYLFAGWFKTTQESEEVEVFPESLVTDLIAHELKALWMPALYDVYFDLQSEHTTPLDQIKVVYNEPYGSLPEPVSLGYIFKGWFTEASFGTQIEDTSIVKITQPQLLYAHWEPEVISVVFDSDGGFYEGESYKLVRFFEPYGDLPETFMSGHRFCGWYTLREGKGEKITLSTLVAVPSDHTLYAHWEPEDCLIVFNSNGGTSVVPSFKKIKYLDSYGDLPIPTKYGFEFVGWFTSQDPGIAEEITSYTFVDSEREIFAHWQPAIAFVELDPNGGTIDYPYYVEVSYGASYDYLPEAEKLGFAFRGWYTELNAGGTEITHDSIVTMPYAHTLYAYFEPIILNLKYSTSGNGMILGAMEQQASYMGETLEVVAVPDTGYFFVSWSDGLQSANRIDRNIVEDAVYYAIFEPFTYTILYSASDHGHINGDTTQFVLYGRSSTEVIAVADDNYTFVMWSDGLETPYRSDYGVINNAQYVAIFEKNHTVYFEANGGFLEAPSSQIVASGSYIVEPPSHPVKEHYIFGGWYQDELCNYEWNFFIDKVQETMTLYAYWIPRAYSVSFDTLKPEILLDSQAITFGHRATAPQSNMYENMTIIGWYKDSELLNRWDFDQDKVEGDTVLYAKWSFFGGGKGTEADPYLISHPVQLLNISLQAGFDKCYKQTRDIDLQELATIDEEYCWSPIGSSEKPFVGSYDGANFNIRGVVIKDREANAGLFGYVNNADSKLANICLEHLKISDGENVGGLVGQLENGLIHNSRVSGNIQLSEGYSVGGLVGINKGLITACETELYIQVTSADWLGGLVGRNSGKVAASTNYSTINISYSLAGVGGVVGSNFVASELLYCGNHGRIEVGSGIYVGGLVAHNAGKINNCYSQGSVLSVATHVAGLVAYNTNVATIKNSYSASLVANNKSGFLASNENYSAGSLMNNFWDYEVAQTTVNAADSATPLTTEEAKKADSYVGWDFYNIWNIEQHVTYPFLRHGI